MPLINNRLAERPTRLEGGGEQKALTVADLDVSNLLLLKLVYGFLQLLGGACGVHGGPLELALGLGRRQQRYR